MTLLGHAHDYTGPCLYWAMPHPILGPYTATLGTPCTDPGLAHGAGQRCAGMQGRVGIGHGAHVGAIHATTLIPAVPGYAL